MAEYEHGTLGSNTQLEVLLANANATSMKAPALPKVMSTPPTVTSTLGFQGTTITSPRYVHLSTYLTSSPLAGATTLSLVSVVNAGNYLLGTEPVTITGVSGASSPYTATLASPLASNHTSGFNGDILATVAIRFDGSTRRTWTFSGSAPNDFAYQSAAVTGSGGSVTTSMSVIDYITDSARIGLDVYAGNSMMILVDGELASTKSYNFPMSNGVRSWIHIDFAGVRQNRRITLIGNMQIARIALETYANIQTAPVPAGPLVGVITDSYGQQPSTACPSGGPWVSALLRLGWTRFLLSAVGGTGYLNMNGSYTTFRQRMAADILAGNPDILYVPGGINDQGRQTSAELQSEAAVLFSQARAALPKLFIIADSVQTPNGTLANTSGYTNVRDGVKNALLNISGPWLFIDNITGGWICSDGRSSPGAGQFQTGNGKGPVAPPDAIIQTLQGSGGTFGAGTYFWVVTATSATGETTVSNEITATLSANYTVTIAASGPTGATGLKLYRGTASGAENIFVGTFSPNGSITDTGGGSAGTPPATNTSASVANNGNADYYIPDGTHTNPDGSDYLGVTRAEIINELRNMVTLT